MEKKNFQQLQFFPLINWPTSLPAISIGNVIVAGVIDSNDSQTMHQLNFESPEKTSQQFFDIHPLLTLPEIARVIHHPVSEGWLDKDRLIQNYGFYPSPDFYKVCKLLVQLPLDFQNLMGIKKMGLSELLPLLSLDLETVLKVTQSILERSESKSETVQRIEWLSDLILIHNSVENFLPMSLIQLRALRFPETTQRDDSLKNTRLPWSTPIKTKMHRKGDAAGFDIQFFAGSPSELEKIAENLKKVASSWNSNLQ